MYELFPYKNLKFIYTIFSLANNNKEYLNSTIVSTVFIVGVYALYQFFYKVPEIDWQEFRTAYLGTDSVGKIEVINKSQVYVYPKVSSYLLTNKFIFTEMGILE